MTALVSSSTLQRAFLRYQHVLVFIAPAMFVTAVVLAAPLPAGAGDGYWLEFWWLFPAFLLGATIVNTVGISGSALFVPFLIFLFPVFVPVLSPETLVSSDLAPATIVKVGLISESFGLSSSALAFIRYGLVDRRLALALVGGSLPFVVGGALLSFVIPEAIFHSLLGIALLAASYLLLRADLGHEEPDATGSAESTPVETDGGEALPDDSEKPGQAGVETEDGVVTRVDQDGDDYTYQRSGYVRRFANYSVGGVFQGLAGFGIGELGIISMLRTSVPVRVAIGTNHIVVALTAVIASLVHVFGGGLVPGGHALDLGTTPWNMVVWTVPATVTGGQLAPYVSAALDTEYLKHGVGVLFAIIAVALFVMASGGLF